MLKLNEQIITGTLEQLKDKERLKMDQPTADIYFGLTSIVEMMNKVYLTDIGVYDRVVKREIIKQLENLVAKGEVDRVLVAGDVRIDHFEYCRGYRLHE